MAHPPQVPQVGWTVVPHPLDIGGFRLSGELLYWGRGLLDASGNGAEPALVDPWLPVDWRDPDWSGRTLDYWPSYSELAPQARAAYLSWIASGRSHPDAPIGYVFLFFYGLERRLLHDLIRAPEGFGAEFPMIVREVDRLLGIYGGNASFERYARNFRQTALLLNLAQFDLTSYEPPAPDRVTVPAALRLGLSGFATAKLPLPANWALTWVRSQPEHAPRTPATRCAPELEELFAVRYRERFGDGLILRPRAKDLRVEYFPASPGFRRTLEIPLPGRPDVFSQAAPLRKATALFEECTDALDAYSRFLGRRPDGRGSLGAVALLPPELQDGGPGEAAELLEWAGSYLGGMSMVTVPADQLVARLAAAQPAKKDLVDVARVLDRAGIGMEPDPRMGGPVQTTGRIVLFRAEGAPEAAPSESYQSAALLLRLGTAMSATDGHVAAEEKALLVDHLEKGLDLSSGERTRLRAHLRWLLTTEPKLTGLTKRIAALDTGQKERVAGFLAAVAAADGVIDPAEVKLLKRIRKMLGLDPEGVHASLHAAAVSPPPAAAPVTVRAAEPVVRHPIPAAPTAPESGPDGLVRLDESLLAARLAEAAEVAALLGSVFEQEEEPAPPPAIDVPPVAGLDSAHSALLRALAGHEAISRADWERLAAEVRLLPDGALDRLNEAALEHTGEPVTEGDDPIEINPYAMGELL